MSGETQERLVLYSLRPLLELLPEVLAAAHRNGPKGPLQDQARSMLQVGRILSTQVEAYLELTELDRPKRRS